MRRSPALAHTNLHPQRHAQHHRWFRCASHHGADFYKLPRNKGSVTLVREEWTVPKTLRFGEEELVPLRAGETIPWKLA